MMYRITFIADLPPEQVEGFEQAIQDFFGAEGEIEIKEISN